MSLFKTNGRLKKSKETADRKLKEKVYSCPKCGKQHNAQVEFGEVIKCPDCGTEMLETF